MVNFVEFKLFRPSHGFSNCKVFHEMVNGGVEANLHTYGALIDGCAKAGQVAKAFGAYGILRSKVYAHPYVFICHRI